jgi:uncharacterized caspase-like protein
VVRCSAALDRDRVGPPRLSVGDREDVLVVCYLGHGLLDARGELYLATQATDHLRDGLGYTALPYATLHAELAKSRARSVIVLLDCCFSGRAMARPIRPI